MAFFVFAAACVLVLIIVATLLVQKYFTYSKIARDQIKELDGERRLYKSLYDEKSDVFIVLNESDKIPAYVSGGTERLMGIKKSELMADIYALKWAVDQSEVSAFNNEYGAWDSKSVFSRDFRFTHVISRAEKTGRVEITRRESDNALVIKIKDITADAEEKRALEDEINEIKKVNKYRNEFISNISHEIRTPFTSIQGQLQLAAMNADNPEEVKRFTNGISMQTNKLLALLNDMFDITRMDGGEVELEYSEFDIMATAKKISDTYTNAMMIAGINFELELRDLNARYFMGDDLRLQQILIAFIEHAQDITDKGDSINVSIRQMNKSTDKANFLFRISDTGRRITQQYAIDMLNSGRGGNSSIVVADQLVRVMGGQIMFDSDNEGNDFSIFISFPLADRVQDMDAEIDMEDDLINKDFTFEGCKLLLAEDNEMNAEISKELLETMGAIVDIAENGRVAVEKFMRGGNGRYHAILMDIEMPEMDGIAAAKKIRSLYGAEAKVIPIFALSSNSYAEDKKRSAEAGMNGHLSKPIDLEILKHELARYL